MNPPETCDSNVSLLRLAALDHVIITYSAQPACAQQIHFHPLSHPAQCPACIKPGSLFSLCLRLCVRLVRPATALLSPPFQVSSIILEPSLSVLSCTVPYLCLSPCLVHSKTTPVVNIKLGLATQSKALRYSTLLLSSLV